MTAVVSARPEVSCRLAGDAADRAAHHRVRHTVFVDEQQIFTGSDRDTHDDPATLSQLQLASPGAARVPLSFRRRPARSARSWVSSAAS